MQKYFSILASSHRSGTLDGVIALENDDTYNNDYTNDYVIVESDSSLSWAEIE